MVKTIVSATPEQVEKKWDPLTEWQKSQVRYARALGRPLSVTILSIGEESNILYDLTVKT